MNIDDLKDNVRVSKYDWFNVYTLNNDLMGRDIINGKCWEPHIVKFLNTNLTPDSVFVDVGSNYGWHSIIASKLCKEVYSFEPQKVMFEIQKMSISENGLDNCKVFNIGLGDIEIDSEMSSIDYFSNGINIGDLSVGSGGEKIKIKKFDSLNLGKVDIIKIDVQGYEKFIIDGSTESIKKYKPIMIVEFEDFQLKKFNYDSKYLFNKIRDLDYEIYYLEYSYPSDHVCVHNSMVKEFELINNVKPLESSNHLNFNLENGVNKKIIT